MEMELNRQVVSINESLLHNVSRVLVEGDIIVPDVKPDMLKVLQIDANAIVTDKRLFDGKIICQGKVHLKILYVPENEESLRNINTHMDFTAELENNAIASDCNCIVETDVTHVEFTMVNSRKLSLRCMVDMLTEVIGETTTEMVCDIEGDAEVQMQKRDIQMYSIVSATATSFNLSDTLDFPAGKPSAFSILKIDAKITDKDVRAVTGKLVIKGIVGLCTLYTSAEDNSIEFMEHELPFTEVIDVENASENMSIDTDLNILDCSFEPRIDQDGELRLIDIDIVFGLKAVVMSISDVKVVSDCYVPGYNTKIDTKVCSINSIAGIGRTQHTLRDIIGIDADTPEVARVYNLIARPSVANCRVESGRVCVDGVVECYVLYLSGNSQSPIASIKKEMEFSCVIDVDGAMEGMDSEVKAELAHASYNLTMAGEMEIRCVINLNARVIKHNEIELITDVSVSDITEEFRPGMIIYFASDGDTLWSVGKHYGVKLEHLIEINQIEMDSALMPGQQLIIPIRRRR